MYGNEQTNRYSGETANSEAFAQDYNLQKARQPKEMGRSDSRIQNPRMGRKSELATCHICGYSDYTHVHYVRGPCAYCCILFLNCLVPFISLMCLCGAPFCCRKSCWDLEHYCTNCHRKLGYNTKCSSNCICCRSTAVNMPYDTY